MAPVETTMPQQTPSARCRLIAAALLVSALMAVAAPASAFPEYPAAVQDALTLSCAPPCLLCHDTPSGGLGTANQPFVSSLSCFGSINLKNVGLRDMTTILQGLETLPCRTPANACMPMGMTPCDTDGDGTTDVEELKNDTNPNPGGADLACPHYGCGARIAPARPRRPIDGTAALAALGTLVLLIGRWRRR